MTICVYCTIRTATIALIVIISLALLEPFVDQMCIIDIRVGGIGNGFTNIVKFRGLVASIFIQAVVAIGCPELSNVSQIIIPFLD